jgi:hypothetical protein
MPDELRLDMEAVIEIRNHIVHPSRLPYGKLEWPASLQRLRDQQVLLGDMPQRLVSKPAVLKTLACNLSMKFPLNRETTSTCLEIETSSLAR